jgi:hypothetical protein
LADSFEPAIAALDLDLSPHDDKELVALFALPEDRCALREIAGRDLPPHKKTEIDLVVRHFASLRIVTGPHAVARVLSYPAISGISFYSL